MTGVRDRAGPRGAATSTRRGAPALAASLVVLCLLGAAPGPVAGQPVALEGDPFRGRHLFVDKHCVQCHAVWEHGGSLGPDISRVVAGKPLPQLAGEFWNHTPRMIEEMTGKGYSWPIIERDEMADLLSYFYYLRLFDDPGDPIRGSASYARLGCESCHSVGGQGGSVGSALDGFAAYLTPVPLAQAMWNAGPDMRREQAGRATPMPEFVGDEMADLQAFIREQGTRETTAVELLPFPAPDRGEEIFSARRCASCHGAGSKGGPDLGAAALRMTVSEISGVLWNHSYVMQDTMKARGIPFPLFQDNEMADLVSYLYFMGFRGRPGDPARGATVFQVKGCVVCHEGEGTQAPGLAGSSRVRDAIALSAAMWNHAPEMHELMEESGVPWPRFEAGEMEDLAAYLGELAEERPTVAGSEPSP